MKNSNKYSDKYDKIYKDLKQSYKNSSHKIRAYHLTKLERQSKEKELKSCEFNTSVFLA